MKSIATPPSPSLLPKAPHVFVPGCDDVSIVVVVMILTRVLLLPCVSTEGTLNVHHVVRFRLKDPQENTRAQRGNEVGW